MARHAVTVDCATGQITVRDFTIDEEARADGDEQAAVVEQSRRDRLEAAFALDLADLRLLLPKLRRGSTANLAQADLRLIGRMLAWNYLRDEMGG